MKRILLFLSALFIATTAIAHTINWDIDGNIFHTTTCESGENVTPPTAPEKYGYTFQGWDSYIPIEYLESTGTQYIDTGFAWDNTIEFEIKLFIQEQNNNQNHSYYGCWTTWDNSGKVFPGLSTYINYRVFTNFDAGVSNTSGIDIGIRNYQTGIISLRNNTMAWDLGSSVAFNRGSYFIVNKPPYLFASNNGVRGVDEQTATKLYFAKFWLQGDLIRDFIPVLDKYGTPCMFDLVEHKFYYNAGTGNFIAGPIIGE